MLTYATDLTPFWLSKVMRDESVLFIAEDAAGPAAAGLLFAPDQVFELRSADDAAVYALGVDFVVDKPARRLRLTPGSRVPFVTRPELPAAPAFHRLQCAATYAHAHDPWPAGAPGHAAGAVPNTLARLRAKTPFTLCVTGDCIAEGGHASGFIGAPPWQPPFADLVAAGLEHAFGTRITLRNFAMSGATSRAGLAVAAAVAAAEPQLVLVAFGMNDAGTLDAAAFRANVAEAMATVRRTVPEAEFVLVSPMLPHPARPDTPRERFVEYRDALASLCGPGAVLADVTSMWTELLARKSVYDVTGDGLRHPNDFGHRLYAQVVLSRLVDGASRGGTVD